MLFARARPCLWVVCVLAEPWTRRPSTSWRHDLSILGIPSCGFSQKPQQGVVVRLSMVEDSAMQWLSHGTSARSVEYKRWYLQGNLATIGVWCSVQISKNRESNKWNQCAACYQASTPEKESDWDVVKDQSAMLCDPLFQPFPLNSPISLCLFFLYICIYTCVRLNAQTVHAYAISYVLTVAIIWIDIFGYGYIYITTYWFGRYKWTSSN